MGDRRDFVEMFGLPEELTCIQCGEIIETRFYESSMFRFELPIIKVHLYCGICEYNHEDICEWWYQFELDRLNTKVIPIE